MESGTKKGKRIKKGKKLDVRKLNDPVCPEVICPPKSPRETLVSLLKKNELQDKEVFGYAIPRRILQELTAAEIKDLIDVFQIFDQDKDGFMTPLDLKRALKALGFHATKTEAVNSVNEASFKRKGFINVVEFLDVVIDKQGDSHDLFAELVHGFNCIDCEKRNKISLQDLRHACVESGLRFTMQDLEDMIHEADMNGDGVIDQSEFINIMLKTDLFSQSMSLRSGNSPIAAPSSNGSL